jgi:hypothetical protein
MAKGTVLFAARAGPMIMPHNGSPSSFALTATASANNT